MKRLDASRSIAVLRLAAVATVLLAGLCASDPGRAQGRLEARYTASIAGIPIGRGSWAIDIGEDHYTAAASARVSGLLRMLSDGEGSVAARGTVDAKRLSPTSYAMRVTVDNKVDEVRMTLNAGNVADVEVDPVWPPSPERVPVSDAHRRGIVDPMSAGLIWVSGTGDVLAPESCHRTLPIFDGRQRFDLTLSYKRMDQVKADKGYQGPVLVCMVTYQPISGHRPARTAIKYLMQQRDMEMWFAPIPATRVLVPFRISIPTMIGTAVLEASQFVTTIQSSRVGAPASKTE